LLLVAGCWLLVAGAAWRPSHATQGTQQRVCGRAENQQPIGIRSIRNGLT